IYVYEKDIPQSVVEMIAPGIAHTDPAWHHAEILNFVLGGSGFGSHLMEEIREKRGLTYGIYSGLSSMDHGATLSIGTSTKNESTAEMLSLIGAEVDKLKTNGLTAQELKDAQSYLIGSVPLSLTSTDRISGFLLSAQVRGYGMDYLEKREATIQSATLADVKAVGDRLLNPKAFTTIIVGSPQNLEPVKTITTIPNAE
ncbi:MAG TPA: insulinase family protein, partial [Alphaproteobacteria bacterium]|nr:insulinase family protein [Alphaproteobacteria bacterium]